MHPRARLGYPLTLFAALIWAATSPGIKYLLDTYHIPALTVALWRDVFMGLACLGALLALRPALLKVRPRDLRGFALTGVVSIGLYHALWVYSIALNGAAVAIVLIYTFPTFVTLGAWLFFRERITWPQAAALALSLAGCALLARAYDPAVLRVSWVGTLVGLATGLTHAGYVLFSQRAVAKHSPWTSLTYTVLFGSLALLVISGAAAPRDILAVGSTPAPWLALMALSLGPTLVGYAVFTLALRYIPARTASLLAVVEAPVSTLLAVFFLGERLEPAQVVGIGLILGAIALPQLLAPRGAPEAAAPAEEPVPA